LTAVLGVNCRKEIEYLRTHVNQIHKKIEDDPSNPGKVTKQQDGQSERNYGDDVDSHGGYLTFWQALT